MDKISPFLLRDTLNLIQLARETARLQGIDNQAERLEPVVDRLKDLVRQPAETTSNPVPASSGILGQSDFELLLKTSQAEKSKSTSEEVGDRNRVIQAMSASGMNEIDIARQFGITRGEVRTVVSLNQNNGMSWS